METLTPPPPTTVSTTLTAAIATVKTPDPDSEPPQSTAVTNQLPPPLTNGVLKRHKPFHHHQPPPAPAAVVTYKECMKNHAAPMGGHATDGCGEFMPSPTSSPSYPTSLKCAACGCHRNFHRREPDDTLFLSTTTQHVIEYQPHHRHHPPPPPPPAAASPGNSPSPPPISSSYYPSAPHMLLALSSGVSPPPSDNLPTNPNIPAIPTTPGSGPPGTGFGLAGSNPSGKKRFRTKFTQDQKEKMHEIAERVGWKMQKRDEDMIIGFCNQIGVDKNVFKVWMHNNKTTFGIKKIDNNVSSINNGNSHNSSAEGIDFIISRNQDLHGHHHDHQQHLVVNNVMCTKGSSSSS